MVVTIDRTVGHERDADSEILMISEVAHFLRMPKSMMYKLVRAGQLPGQKIGKQ
jgi:predicted DNA-binding transcriptional regulator AlpA